MKPRLVSNPPLVIVILVVMISQDLVQVTANPVYFSNPFALQNLRHYRSKRAAHDKEGNYDYFHGYRGNLGGNFGFNLGGNAAVSVSGSGSNGKEGASAGAGALSLGGNLNGGLTGGLNGGFGSFGGRRTYGQYGPPLGGGGQFGGGGFGGGGQGWFNQFPSMFARHNGPPHHGR